MEPGTPCREEKTLRPRCQRWPASRYFVSPRHRLIYCPIPKVACSSLKVWWAEHEAEPTDCGAIERHEALVGMHRKFSERFTYEQYAEELGDGPLDDPRWFRFVFVRNPWARLVSAFVNKFVPWREIAGELIGEFCDRLPRRTVRQLVRPAGLRDALPPWWLLRSRAAWREQFTFRQFVNHLATCNLARADTHWRPQSQFLGQTEFHFIGRLENLDRDFAELTRRLGRPAALPRVNVTRYVAREAIDECVADWPLSRLRELPAAPAYRCFYTPSLVQTVARLYADDIRRLGYQWEESGRLAA